jgi:hypothetical protein
MATPRFDLAGPLMVLPSPHLEFGAGACGVLRSSFVPPPVIRERTARRHVKQLEALGDVVAVQPAA